MASSVPVDKKGRVAFSRLNSIQRKAYALYQCQMQRCYNKNKPIYKRYGGRGLTVDYSREDFIAWFEKNISLFQGGDPTIGRLDHSRGYSFDNIRIESASQNSYERHTRNRGSGPKKRIGLFSKKDDSCIAVFYSQSDCCREIGVSDNVVYRSCYGRKTELIHSWYYSFYKD